MGKITLEKQRSRIIKLVSEWVNDHGKCWGKWGGWKPGFMF